MISGEAGAWIVALLTALAFYWLVTAHIPRRPNLIPVVFGLHMLNALFVTWLVKLANRYADFTP